MSTTEKPAASVYERISAAVLKMIETENYVPWRKPWRASESGDKAFSPLLNKWSRAGRVYSLLNCLLLEKEGEYITFKQCRTEGGHVLKGSKAEYVYFYSRLYWDENGRRISEADYKALPNPERLLARKKSFLKSYPVFHVETQTDLTPQKRTAFPAPAPKPEDGPAPEENAAAENVIRAYVEREKIEVVYGGDSAFFRHGPAIPDLIQIPARTQFAAASEYYSTHFHEMTHSTGTAARLNRGFGTRFGDHAYSREELVAEFGAALSLARLGMQEERTEANSAAYLANWAKALKGEEGGKMLVKACSEAEKAVKYIFGDAA